MTYATQDDSGVVTLRNGSGGTIGQKLRVKTMTTAGAPASVEVCTASDRGIGHTEYESAAGDLVAVRLGTKSGTRLGVATGAIGIGVEVFAAAGGQVAGSGTVSLGFALVAASGAGAILEYAPEV